jgi:hypothetical protein
MGLWYYSWMLFLWTLCSVAKAWGAKPRVLQSLLHKTEAQEANCSLQPLARAAGPTNAQDALDTTGSPSNAEWHASRSKYGFCHDILILSLEINQQLNISKPQDGLGAIDFLDDKQWCHSISGALFNLYLCLIVVGRDYMAI